jgi:metal-responsive CopG/Arc/MetJ family transcriptional regulator
MEDGKALLSDELLHQVEAMARAQNRQPAEVIADAVRKYLEEQSWRNSLRTTKTARAQEASVSRMWTA